MTAELIECPACSGSGEVGRCVNDGRYGCSHQYDVQLICWVCQGEGALTAADLAEAADGAEEAAAEHDAEPEEWVVEYRRTARVSERATDDGSRSAEVQSAGT